MSRVSGFLAAIAVIVATAHPGMAQQHAPQTWQDFIPFALELDKAAGEDRSIRLEQLATLFEADTADVSDSLERDTGGRAAAQAYIRALLETNQAERLADQLALVLVDGEINTPVEQDGSTWFPLAEQAGFFTGAAIAVIAEAPQRDTAIAAIAAKLAVPPPVGDLGEWLPQALSASLSPPVMTWFDKGYRASLK